MSTFKKIIGGTEEEAYAKFPWLKSATFVDAEIDINNSSLVWENGWWEDGTWQDGTWKGGWWEGGTWQNGLWQNGLWRDGLWQDGRWEGGWWQRGRWQDGSWQGGVWKYGEMWSNREQRFIEVEQKENKFVEKGS